MHVVRLAAELVEAVQEAAQHCGREVAGKSEAVLEPARAWGCQAPATQCPPSSTSTATLSRRLLLLPLLLPLIRRGRDPREDPTGTTSDATPRASTPLSNWRTGGLRTVLPALSGAREARGRTTCRALALQRGRREAAVAAAAGLLQQSMQELCIVPFLPSKHRR